jgi:ADP-heptose:LPS heptosyltransferase
MTEPKTILVLHPMAIGDVVLGTPVAAALKRIYPGAKVIYFTHTSLVPLLRLCHAIDEYVDWTRKAPLLTQLSTIKQLRPDLIVDLTSSTRTRLLCLLSGIRTVSYRKQPRAQRPVEHVSDRYMQTLSKLPQSSNSTDAIFPTLQPDTAHMEKLEQSLENNKARQKSILALIPGVGSLRPNRAWPESHWLTLARKLRERDDIYMVLIGGPDENQLCEKIREAAGAGNCENYAGRLSLPETAALLKLARLAVSGDTGPCHIAVSVGTPVVSMMGPTLQARSGPYSYQEMGFDVSAQCQCTAAKTCVDKRSAGAGVCMDTIAPEMVLERIDVALDKICAKRQAFSAGSCQSETAPSL